jgi:hypothetical protein
MYQWSSLGRFSSVYKVRLRLEIVGILFETDALYDKDSYKASFAVGNFQENVKAIGTSAMRSVVG